LVFSLEHPTPTEQTIKSPANTSVLVFLSKLILPQATESWVAGVVRDVTVRNWLMRIMVGHLLLLKQRR
jgi:hypothetical protein